MSSAILDEKCALSLQTEVMNMTKQIRVVILEDHQSTLEGYLYRLTGHPDIDIAATPSLWVRAGAGSAGLAAGPCIDSGYQRPGFR